MQRRRPFLLGLVALTAANALSLVAPWLLKVGLDRLGRGVTQAELISLAFWIVVSTAASGVARYAMRRQMIGASRWVEYDLRNDFFAHISRLSTAFYQRHPTGDLMALATNDLNAIRNFVGPGIMHGAGTAVTLVGTLVLMFILSPKLTLVAMIPLPLLSLSMGRFGQLIHVRFERVQEEFARITARAQEYLAGIRVVKAYAQESYASADFRTRNEEFVHQNLRLVKIWGAFYPSLSLLTGIAAALVLWIGGLEVMNGAITIGDFVAFNSYLMMLIWPMMALGWVVNLYQRGAASMGRVQRILEATPEITDPPSDRAVPGDRAIRGEIEFRNVSFEYPSRPGHFALRDVSLRVPAGTTVAIVGRTGSGKSTLVHLVPRLYDPTAGQVLLDGRPLPDYPLDRLRGAIGHVAQETFLFSRTIGQNIALGVAEASDRQIEEMATIVRLDGDVQDFPRGYDTLVGERGVTLSGGQKQRTAIARAILREPTLLILDDALSAVDTKTEEEILRGLTAVMKSRTTLLVSHRVSTVRHADCIVVLDHGRIVEQGTHAALLAQGGLYTELERLQRLRDELEVEA